MQLPPPERQPAQVEQQPVPVHILNNQWTFWFRKRADRKQQAQSYDKSMENLGTFNTAEDFYAIYNHMVRPESAPQTTDYHLFKAGVKPAWEDAANKHGGKWVIRLRKGFAGRFWEAVLLAMIGEQFQVGNEICGAVLSVRYNEDILSIWNRNWENRDALNRIQHTLRSTLHLPNFVNMDYKRHEGNPMHGGGGGMRDGGGGMRDGGGGMRDGGGGWRSRQQHPGMHRGDGRDRGYGGRDGGGRDGGGRDGGGRDGFGGGGARGGGRDGGWSGGGARGMGGGRRMMNDRGGGAFGPRHSGGIDREQRDMDRHESEGRGGSTWR